MKAEKPKGVKPAPRTIASPGGKKRETVKKEEKKKEEVKKDEKKEEVKKEEPPKEEVEAPKPEVLAETDVPAPKAEE